MDKKEIALQLTLKAIDSKLIEVTKSELTNTTYSELAQKKVTEFYNYLLDNIKD